MTIIVPAILGFIAGVIGSLIAPWVHWSIEKRRSKFQYRQKLIETWRREIEDFNWGYDDFGDSTAYAAIRPHMALSTIDRFEAQRTVHVPPDGGRGANLPKQWASDEVTRIEKRWVLR